MVNSSAGTTAGTTASIEVVGLRKSFGSSPVLRDVALTVPRGAVVALLGPSGCGKTTLLRTVAGLERADAGEIRIGGRVVAGPGRHVPPERRQVGMVFQDWALFPHLSVSQNVGYGLGRAERKGPRVAEVLAMVGLDGLGDRQPATLSGGQQQRVALARALAPRPGVLLLDEPFSNLDATLRVQVRSEVHQLLTELDVTTVFVTHDQEEAFLLGDEVAVVHGGRIVQQAPPAALYARPATPWVASFVGDANLVSGEAAGDHAVTGLGAVPLETPATGAVWVLLRPEELRLEPSPRGADGQPVAVADVGGPEEAPAPPDGSPSVFPGSPVGVPVTVELREYYGHDTVYVVRPAAAPGVDHADPAATAGVDHSDLAADGVDGADPLAGADDPDPAATAHAPPQTIGARADLAADGPVHPDASTWGNGAVSEIRVRAGSIPQFARGDRAWLRYVGPPALAFPRDGLPSAAATGHVSDQVGAGHDPPGDHADARGRPPAAPPEQPAAGGERTVGGADGADDADGLDGVRAARRDRADASEPTGGGAGDGGDERADAHRSAPPVSERLARHAPTR